MAVEHFLRIHPEMKQATVGGKTVPVGVAFDGRSAMFTSQPLPITSTIHTLSIH
jgi:hypothetical protein